MLLYAIVEKRSRDRYEHSGGTKDSESWISRVEGETTTHPWNFDNHLANHPC